MAGYSSTLTAVVAIVVAGAAVAGLVAATGLLAVSARRRRRLATLVQEADAVWPVLERLGPDAPRLQQDDVRRSVQAQRHPLEWDALAMLRASTPHGRGPVDVPARLAAAGYPRPDELLRPLDELESLPSELIGWATVGAPDALRPTVRSARELLELDRDVRRVIAGGRDVSG
ncbi:hypothetical protein ACPPVT_01130 [Angustibacter sp. McL0619]|uniref:hypothetical protein n=1 Tax=Angustibacter sp. McL0619 TaxID=3415676 RepID=UPI003CEE6468